MLHGNGANDSNDPRAYQPVNCGRKILQFLPEGYYQEYRCESVEENIESKKELFAATLLSFLVDRVVRKGHAHEHCHLQVV